MLKLVLSLLICTVAVSPDDVFPQNQFDEIQIQSTDIDPDPPGFSSSESRYGSDVVLHDGRLVMSGTGSPLIVFQKIDDAWEELQVLFLPQGATLPSSTRPLALAKFGNFLLVGDPAASIEGTSTQTGLVYLAEWNGSAYQVAGVLTPEEPAMQSEFSAFGAALSISSNFLFVGAPGADDGKGRVFAYDIPSSFPDIVLQSPIASLQAPSSGAEGFGASLGASESWLVTKQQTPGGTVPVSAVAYPLSPAVFDSPVIINLDAQSFESGGSDIHVRSDVVLIRRKKDFSSFSTKVIICSSGLRLADSRNFRCFLMTTRIAASFLLLQHPLTHSISCPFSMIPRLAIPRPGFLLPPGTDRTGILCRFPLRPLKTCLPLTRFNPFLPLLRSRLHSCWGTPLSGLGVQVAAA